jgi:A/G-specific adenine glycosylase
MDYGVFLKAKYRQINKRSAHYVRQSTFQGSHRQVRGAIIRELATRRQSTLTALARVLGYERERVKLCIEELKKEGFLVQEGRSFSLGE